MPFEFWLIVGAAIALAIAIAAVVHAKKNDKRKITDDPGDHRDISPYI